MQLHEIRMQIIKFVVVILLAQTLAKRCDRRPSDAILPRSPVNGRYVIEIGGNPMNYSPGKKYTITLRGVEDNEQNRFMHFVLIIESDGARYGNGNGQDVGNLIIIEDALTQFHIKCPNAVMETNSIPKSEIQVQWIAPPEHSGCVAIRATVVLSREVWYSDDGPLTMILCENAEDDNIMQPPILEECCACHEAKYEVTFEGLWSRNTHPKDFPPNNFLTKFSDIIGATHSVNYKFWDYGELASDGLAELAEHGNTKALERELKDMSEEIRTIIKARGISYPNITGKTFAVFRVDESHHLMSLVSMVHPSPDWIVGVSSLELCQSNCSWVESKVLNLYPWDAGTDNGTTYLAEDSPNIPREPITRITSTNPSHVPFYDEQGNDMKPLARIILSRQRLYEKHTCRKPPYIGGDNRDEQCTVTDWSDWSPCNVLCGKGNQHRQRYYKFKVADRIKQQAICKKTLTQRRTCYGVQPECRTEVPPGDECELTPWGKLSQCSVTCGNGTMTSSRKYKSRADAKRCGQMSSNPPRLEQNVPCIMPPCDGNSGSVDIPPECENRAWSEWSPCSASCGKGVKIRKKLSINIEDVDKHKRHSDTIRIHNYDDGYNNGYDDLNAEEEEKDDDGEDVCASVIDVTECVNDQLESCNDTTATDTGEAIDCEVSEWSKWSPCTASCGGGTKTKTRQILEPPQNGGKSCPKRLIKKKVCGTRHCLTENDANCLMSKWSSWSPCNVSCGPNAVRQRTRNILQNQKGEGRACPDRVQIENCNLPVCPEV